MERSRLGRPVVGVLAAMAMLAGCGGAGATGSAPTAMTQSVARHATTSTSGALLYVSTTKDVLILSYPNGTVVGSLPWYGTSLDYSICSDPDNGNVYIPEDNAIYVYAHGAMTPTAALSIPTGDTEPNGCAVDPTTHVLAVIVWTPPHNRNAFLVYPGAQGTPVTYPEDKGDGLIYATYDDAGNLFSMTGARDGYQIAELRHGRTKFNLIKFTNCAETCGPAKMQFDGKYFAFYRYISNGHNIAQVSVDGKAATLVNSIQLAGLSDRTDAIWIYDGLIFSEYQKLHKNNDEGIAAWPYPAGGNPTAKFYGITKGIKDSIGDITVSVAPTR